MIINKGKMASLTEDERNQKMENRAEKNAAWLPGSGQSGGWIMFAKEIGGCHTGNSSI